MTVVAVVQARMGSTRLPGKVLADLNGQPLLRRLLARLDEASSVDDIILATSTSSKDDELATVAQGWGVRVARGSEDDVLSRFSDAIAREDADVVVRITADCPFVDPDIVDSCVQFLTEERLDYVSSAVPPTLPDGLDVEVIRRGALLRAATEAKAAYEREHVTPYLRAGSSAFRTGSLQNASDLSALRWTVDTASDLAFARAVFTRLSGRETSFRTRDVLALLDANPQLAALNGGQVRNEGFLKSLAAENLNAQPVEGAAIVRTIDVMAPRQARRAG